VRKRNHEFDYLGQEWQESGARTFWMCIAFGSLGLSGWWYFIGPFFGYGYHPLRAGAAIVVFAGLGFIISVCDDGGIEAEPF
jgi:hypothetical protein